MVFLNGYWGIPDYWVPGIPHQSPRKFTIHIYIRIRNIKLIIKNWWNHIFGQIKLSVWVWKYFRHSSLVHPFVSKKKAIVNSPHNLSLQSRELQPLHHGQLLQNPRKWLHQVLYRFIEPTCATCVAFCLSVYLCLLKDPRKYLEIDIELWMFILIIDREAGR